MITDDFFEMQEELISRGCKNFDNNTLCKKLQQETIKIFFLGCSITYGYDPSCLCVEKPYPVLVEEKLKVNFPQKRVVVKTRGFSGTDCLMGLIATQRFVKNFQPDIIFLDYSVNEASTPEGVEKYESLCRCLYNLESQPDVIPVCFCCKNSFSSTEMILAVAQHYNQLAVDIGGVVKESIASGKIQWQDYSADECHPNWWGHNLISQCIAYALKKISDALNKTSEISLPNKITPCIYENIKLLDMGQMKIEGTISNTYDYYGLVGGVSNSRSMTLSFNEKFSRLIITSVVDNTLDFGAINVFVDGIAWVINGYSIFGWNNPICAVAYTSKVPDAHSVEIEMCPGDENKRFILLQIAIC